MPPDEKCIFCKFIIVTSLEGKGPLEVQVTMDQARPDRHNRHCVSFFVCHECADNYPLCIGDRERNIIDILPPQGRPDR